MIAVVDVLSYIVSLVLYIEYLVCFMFFFFKQKTAYEMRISDWSSDVCSSDLPKVLWLHEVALSDAAKYLIPRPSVRRGRRSPRAPPPRARRPDRKSVV